MAATAPHLLALATLPPASLFSQGLRGAGPPFPRPAEGRQAPDGVMRTGQPVPSVPPTSPQSSAPPPPPPPPPRRLPSSACVTSASLGRATGARNVWGKAEICPVWYLGQPQE